MKKELSIGTIISICSWYSAFESNEDKTKDIPLKLRWYLKKNMDIFKSIDHNFAEIRDKQVAMIQKKYMSDETSIETEPGTRTIKDEYIERYKSELSELKQTLLELVTEVSTYEIQCYDIDLFVDQLPDDTKVTFEDLEYLSFMAE